VTPPRGSAQPPEFAVFHVDASTWIGLHEENYPPDVFPSLWTALSDHAQHGRIKSPHEVMREVGEDQGVGAWLRMQQPSIVPRATPPVQRLVTPTSRRWGRVAWCRLLQRMRRGRSAQSARASAQRRWARRAFGRSASSLRGPPASQGRDGASRPPAEGAQAHDSVGAVGTVRVGEFEWDETKARANVRKHGVTFEEAMTVFLDELAVPFEEGEHPDRLVLIGESGLGQTVLVVFTERLESGTIRLISARQATKRERRAYAEGD